MSFEAVGRMVYRCATALYVGLDDTAGDGVSAALLLCPLEIIGCELDELDRFFHFV